jgi:hypothetical protein
MRGLDKLDQSLALPFDHRFLEAVFGIKYRVSLIAILVEPRPGDLLFAAPGDADRPGGGVAGNEDVMSAP